MSTFAINKNSGHPLKTIENSDNTSILVTTIAQFSPPPDSDSGTVNYPDDVTEVYSFRSGGISGTVLKIVTLVYVDSTKARLASWSSV